MNNTSIKKNIYPNMYFIVGFCIFFVFVYIFYCVLFSCDLLREHCNKIHKTNYTFEQIIYNCYTNCFKHLYIFKNKRGYQYVSNNEYHDEISNVPNEQGYFNHNIKWNGVNENFKNSISSETEMIHLSIHEKKYPNDSISYSNDEIEQYIYDKKYIQTETNISNTINTVNTM